MYTRVAPNDAQDEDFGEDVLITARESKREAAEAAQAGAWETPVAVSASTNGASQGPASNSTGAIKADPTATGAVGNDNDDDDEELYGGVTIKLNATATDAHAAASSAAAAAAAPVRLSSSCL